MEIRGEVNCANSFELIKLLHPEMIESFDILIAIRNSNFILGDTEQNGIWVTAPCFVKEG